MLEIGKLISFKYKGGRKVIGEVVGTDSKRVWLKLHVDYIGKNDEWYEGEEKMFNKKEMKKIANI